MFNQLTVEQEGEKLKFNYLSLPIMFGYGLEENKFLLQAGTQIGYLLSTDPSEMKEDKYMNALDFSLGLGATLNLGKVNVGLRYVIGIANVAASKLSEETEQGLEEIFGEDMDVDVEIRNNTFQFFIGFKVFGE